MDRVIIGVDPRKLSVTIEARDDREIVRATGRFGTDTCSYRQLLTVARQWPQRIWAVEGANGIGRPLAQRLLAGGERVLDVPPKLAARARVFDTGQGRKTDAADAHAIVMVALRDKGLRELRVDPELTVLRMLCDRRDELSRARAQALNRLHRLFLGLLAGGAPVKKSASQYEALLATVRPRDLAGRTCRRMAAEELEDLQRLDVKLKAMKAELKAAVLATGSHLMDIHGIGPAGAARILADVGDVTRFPGRGHFASWNGTAPIDASSGQHTRHRLSRAGNRRINACSTWPGLSSSATTPLAAPATGASSSSPRPPWKRCAACGGAFPTPSTASSSPTPPPARPHYSRRARRALRAALSSSAAASPGHRHFGPATSRTRTPDATPSQTALKTPAAPVAATSRRRATGVNVERPTGRTTLTPTSADARSTAPGPRT